LESENVAKGHMVDALSVDELGMSLYESCGIENSLGKSQAMMLRLRLPSSLGQVTALKIMVELDPTNHYLDEVLPHTIL
jgi:hypothetical protein